MVAKKWLVSSCDKDLAAQIAQEHSLNPFAALLAVSRGITEPESIDEFFFSENDELCDPFELVDMDRAAERLNRAIDEHERIAVFGDYDADGVTATALMCTYLESRGADFLHYIPERLSEGYGLSVSAIDKLKQAGTKVILTVDNGISSVNEVAYANSLGIETVITDHHIAGRELPDAVAVVDPHREDCPSYFKDYAGVGVAFKRVCAMQGGDSSEMLEEYADLAAIGTIGDIVPVVGENRIIVRNGVRLLNENPRPGIRMLARVAGFEGKTLSSTSVAFTLAPRLNAVGRMGSAERALELLLGETEEDVQSVAQEIDSANTERQRIESAITELVEKQLAENPERKYDRVIVCSGEGWHGGVIGIVASRIVERYGRPCMLISSDGEMSKGSGRSIAGFSLFDALSSCSDCLEAFGGHTLAAGLTIRTDMIDEFRRRINEYASCEEMPFPVLKIDFRLNPKSVSMDIIEALTMMEPFGAGNAQPVFGLFKMRIEKLTPVGNGKHLRINLVRNNIRLSAVKFGATLEGFPYTAGSMVDLAVTLDSNEYMGEPRVNIHIRGIRFCAFEEDAMLSGLRIYETLKRGEEPTQQGALSLIPTRDVMGDVYRLLKSRGGWCRGEEALCIETGHTGEDVCTVLLVLDVMEELGLIERDEKNNISINKMSGKVNIEDSEILQKARTLTQEA